MKTTAHLPPIFDALVVALTFAIIALACAAISGCGLKRILENGVDATVKVRPGGKNPDMTPPPEPPKQPDPYDWEPWWNRPPRNKKVG